MKKHSNSDLYIYIPSKRIVFVGDLVFNDRVPSIRDGNLAGWIEALDEVKALDVDYIVGGHGAMITPDSVVMTYNYLSDLKNAVAEAIENDVGIDDAVNTITLDKYKSIKLYDMMHRQNVEVAYRIL